jgi:iron-sulfur cluster repair protein YtfE (RIC family)
MNALDLLKTDHQKVEELFKQAEAAGAGGDRSDIFVEIKANLQAHAYIEESIFYPALQNGGDKALIELTCEALQEHTQAKMALGELSVVDDERFDALLTKLIEDVRHHVHEEEGEMFPMVEAQFDPNALELLGKQMEMEKERFQISGESIYN